ncbi:MAG: hypothetical protein JWN18_543 [Parcubacteria group bacterium]|nr:hypothetical protein [Parcubacteria group bacterium]
MYLMIRIGHGFGTRIRNETDWTDVDIVFFLLQTGSIAAITGIIAYGVFHELRHAVVRRLFVGLTPSAMLFICAGFSSAFPMNPYFGATIFFMIAGTIVLMRLGQRNMTLDFNE